MRNYTEKEMDLLLEQLKLMQNELESDRYPYRLTTQLLEKVRDGDTAAVLAHPFLEADQEFVDSMGPLGDRLMEYYAVNMVTRCGDVCIEAGMDVQNVYDICDTFLHLLASKHSPEMVLNIFRLSPLYFARQVHNMKTDQSYLIERIRIYINRNLFRKITLDDIASHVGLSRSYVSRIFSQKTGGTLQDYIQQKKIESSCNMLIYSRQPISVIAEYYGFSSQSNYSQAFKKWTHETPSQYRNLHANPDFFDDHTIEDSFI